MKQRAAIVRAMEERDRVAETIAEILGKAAQGISPSEFTRVLSDVFGDTSTSDVAQIALYMPPHLQALLPRKYLH